MVGAGIAINSETKTAALFGEATSTVSKVMTFGKEGKTSSVKQNSGRKGKLSDRDCGNIMQIVRKNPKNTALKIQLSLVSSKTVRRELHKAGFYG